MRKALPCIRIGDHQGRPRDVAPGRAPLTFFNEDGTIWTVADVDARLVRTLRKIARREKVDADCLVSAAFVHQLQKLIEQRGRR